MQAPINAPSLSAPHVSNARLILIALILAAPAILMLHGPIMHGLVAGTVAAGIVIMGQSTRPVETEFLLSVIRPAAVVVAIPALWMLIQILPLKTIAHPIWLSAETALGYPIAGSISIDTGATVMALGQYLTLVAVGLLSAAVAVDRQRAEWILFALAGASALMALVLVTHDLFGLTFLDAGMASFARAQAIDGVALGTIIAAAAGIRTVERIETRKSAPDRSLAVLLRTLAACSAAFALGLATLIFGATGGVIIATAYGLAALASVFAIRRLGLGPWGIAALVATAIGVAILIAAGAPGARTNSFALAGAPASPASRIAVSQRMLDDGPATGTGAGTFAAVAPIYRDADDPTALAAAPTAAAAFAVELGRPMLWFIMIGMAGGIFVLLRAALRRGRDSFHPAAAGSCLVAILFLCFVNAGVLGTAAALLAAASVGLGLAQSKSRTV
jgi:hypothetical protein